MPVDKALETVKAGLAHRPEPWLIEGVRQAADLGATNR
jgi:hypothetical protein